MFFILFGSLASAQCTYPAVASNCVGACGSPSEINYTVSPPCLVKARKYCVTNDNSSLCPNNNAIAIVYVDGVFVTSGNITAVGSSVGFKAKCGSDIRVFAFTYYIGGPIQCVWQGQINYSLRQQ